MDLVTYQTATELKYSKRNIKKVVMNDLLSNDDVIRLIEDAVELLEDWVVQTYYESKNARLRQLQGRDMTKIVETIVFVVSQCREGELLTSVIGQVVTALNMSDKIDAIKTASEMLGVISEVGFYEIYKEDEHDSLRIEPLIGLDGETEDFIYETKYLPPMVVEPFIVKSNYDYTCLTEKHSLILGKGNHHEDDICLDSINRFNQVALTLNQTLLTTLSDAPKEQYTDPDVRKQWMKFTKESYKTYKELIQTGNKFYLTHSVDKRGRTYAKGYHVTTQGNKFKKAIVELANKKVVTL